MARSEGRRPVRDEHDRRVRVRGRRRVALPLHRARDRAHRPAALRRLARAGRPGPAGAARPDPARAHWRSRRAAAASSRARPWSTSTPSTPATSRPAGSPCSGPPRSRSSRRTHGLQVGVLLPPSCSPSARTSTCRHTWRCSPSKVTTFDGRRPRPSPGDGLLVDGLRCRVHRASCRLLPVRSVAPGASGEPHRPSRLLRLRACTGTGRSRRPATRRWPHQRDGRASARPSAGVPLQDPRSLPGPGRHLHRAGVPGDREVLQASTPQGGRQVPGDANLAPGTRRPTPSSGRGPPSRACAGRA